MTNVTTMQKHETRLTRWGLAAIGIPALTWLISHGISLALDHDDDSRPSATEQTSSQPSELLHRGDQIALMLLYGGAIATIGEAGIALKAGVGRDLDKAAAGPLVPNYTSVANPGAQYEIDQARASLAARANAAEQL